MSKPIVISLGEILWDMLPTGKRARRRTRQFRIPCVPERRGKLRHQRRRQRRAGYRTALRRSQGRHQHAGADQRYPTGTVAVALTNGIPEYTIVENSGLGPHQAHRRARRAVSKADAVCFGTLGLRSPESHDTIVELLKHTKEGALKFFDINLRANFYSNELIEELLGYANIFKINDEELIMMRDMFSIPECNDEEACKWFIDRFDLEYTILTGGATFSTITAKNGEVSTLLTPHVEVADTVGAGDSFSGSFTGKLLSGAPLKEAHRAAVNTAAYVCTKEGGWPTYPVEGVPDYLAEAGK